MVRLALLLSALAIGAPLGAQADTSVVEVLVARPKTDVIELAMNALSDAGATITDASEAGVITGAYVDGNMMIQLRAAVMRSGASSRVVLSAWVSTRGNIMLPGVTLSDQIDNRSPRQGKKAWAKLRDVERLLRTP